MPKVGDRVRLASRKVGQDPRAGVITGVRGQMISVRWSSGEESSIVPGPGTLTVVGRSTVRPKAAAAKRKPAATRKRPAKKKAVPAKKKAVPAKKKAVPAKKAVAAKKKAAAGKKAARRPGRRR
ncbi:MAG: DUF1918 domain-containing protein [Actinobacteria bacterium]|nr:MAG: DUF1918 domain-containing protein [Actinomycetota bacterium]